MAVAREMYNSINITCHLIIIIFLHVLLLLLFLLLSSMIVTQKYNISYTKSADINKTIKKKIKHVIAACCV